LFLALSAGAAPPPGTALHSVYLSHDLRTATLVAASPGSDRPDSFAIAGRRESVPVEVSWLYDGARFDAFPRNPRTDPAFGADGSEAVSTVVAFSWPAGVPPLPGTVRFFTGEVGQPLFCIGSAPFPGPSGDPETPLRFVLPSASGLSAHRSRTAFQPSPDRESVTESFEIALENDTSSTIPIALVEHLRRSPDWEIVSSSVRQTPDRDANLVRMETTIPPNASKTVSYTVRYRFPPIAQTSPSVP